MKDLERLGEELSRSGKGERLKSLADTAEGKAVSRMVDQEKLERAAKSGDTAALKDILSQVLSTDEGKRLAEKLKKAMG